MSIERRRPFGPISTRVAWSSSRCGLPAALPDDYRALPSPTFLSFDKAARGEVNMFKMRSDCLALPMPMINSFAEAARSAVNTFET